MGNVFSGNKSIMNGINGKILHLKELGFIEDVLFNTVLDPEKFYKELIKYLKANPDIAQTKNITVDQFKKIDKFVDGYLTPRIEQSRIWLLRAYFVGRLLSDSDLRGHLLNIKNVSQMPATIQEYVKKYNLSIEEAQAIKEAIEEGAALLSNTTPATQQTIRNVLVENTKQKGGDKSLENKLREAILRNAKGDPGELNRDWMRVAITEANSIFNNGYLDTLNEGDYVVGISMPDCCDVCHKLIKGQVYRVLKDPLPDYGELDPSTKEYWELAEKYELYVWSGKNNYGRSSSKRKRINKNIGNREENLREKEHHEHVVPALPMHPECRCRWIVINPEYQWVDKEGRIRLRVEDEKQHREWYDKILERFSISKAK